MNMNAQAYDQYRKTSVETVAPEKLLLMLYDGAIKKIDNAKRAIDNKDVNMAHQEIIKVEDIIVELMSTLNMDYEISHSLFALYEYLYSQLVQANFKKDKAILTEVQGFLSELRDTWNDAIKNLKSSGAAEPNEKSGLNMSLTAAPGPVGNADHPQTAVSNRPGVYGPPSSVDKMVVNAATASKVFNKPAASRPVQGINLKG
jgi:flagellar protein FliS